MTIVYQVVSFLAIVASFILWQLFRFWKARAQVAEQNNSSKERENEVIQKAKEFVESKSLEELVRDSNIRYPSSESGPRTDDNS